MVKVNPNTISVPNSWHPTELLDALAAFASQPQVMTIVEIGSWLGHSAIAMAHALYGRDAAARVYCVDHWKGSHGGTGLVTDPLDLYLRFWNNVREAEVTDRIVPIFERSDQAHTLFTQRPIDLLFIDGDHSYDSVTSDLTHWVPLVRPGGIVCGDDYGEQGPHQAFNNFFDHGTIETEVHNRLAIVRLPISTPIE
jgi:predicted O-methyltransferase YrrM